MNPLTKAILLLSILEKVIHFILIFVLNHDKEKKSTNSFSYFLFAYGLHVLIAEYCMIIR